MNASSPSYSMTRQLLRKPLAVWCLVIIAILILSAVLAPWLAPYDPLQQDPSVVRQTPTAQHWLGTDSLGRDILSRLMWGGRESLLGIVEAVGVTLLISIPVGVIAGYARGAFDRAVLAVIDVMMSIPGILITMASLAIFNNSMVVAMTVLGVFAAGAFTRIFRSVVLPVRAEPFVAASIVMGLSHRQIIGRHILPHARGTILVQASLFAAGVLGVQTGLSYLAFGPPPPWPTWGGMVAEAQASLMAFPWMFVPTGGIIAVATLAFGLLGDALRDVDAERFKSSGAKRASAHPDAPVTSDAVPADSSGTPILRVRGLSVAFGRAEAAVTAVQNVSFDVRPGEVLGLVGESGSGKTVTALAVLGLLGRAGSVSSGSIRFEGTELVGDTRAIRSVRGSGIAYISQEPMVALDPSFRVGAQIAEVVRHHDKCSRRAATERALALLEQVRIRDPHRVAKSYPHEISGGMAQRVVIAKALAGHPRLLIADEPTTALDVTVQAEILDLLRSLRQDTGMAMILVTHDWGVVADACDRAAVLYAGQVVEEATAAELIRAPRHPYTRALLGSNPHGARRGDVLPAIKGSVPAPGAWPRGCRFAARCAMATDACRDEPIALRDLGGERVSRCIRIDAMAEEVAR